MNEEVKKIILESRHILFIIKQLEKTDVYWFIHGDVNKVKNYIIKVKKNPKNRTLKNGKIICRNW